MVRKRVILLGITLGLVVNQFMLYKCNKAISAPNYSYTTADSSYSGYSYNNSQQYKNQNSYYGGDNIQPGGYNIDPNQVARFSRLDYLDRLSGLPSRNMTQGYVDQQRQMYNAQMANRAGVPYEEYICQGNFQCIQQMYMNEQQAKAINNHADALRNQNVNIWGTVDMNHYYRY